MNNAVTWDEVARGFRSEQEYQAGVDAHKKQIEQDARNFKREVACYVNKSFDDSVFEDDNGSIFNWSSGRSGRPSTAKAINWLKTATLPVCVITAIHESGSGLLPTKRVVIEKPKTTVYHITFKPQDERTKEKEDEVKANLKLGMPQQLGADWYNIPISTITTWCEDMGIVKRINQPKRKEN
jgi:hypothetical protein